MQECEVKGNISNLQRYSLDDGSGIRTCVFFKGCHLRCKWCHNPESQNFSSEIAFYPDNCILCGSCNAECQNGYHKISTLHTFLRENCKICGKCADSCPANALEYIGKQMSVEEVMQKVSRDSLFYGKRGGVTLTGGEPMSQFKFAYSLAKKIKNAGFSVVIETSGYADSDNFYRMAEYCDCFYYDCKAATADHEYLTGKDDESIMSNLGLLMELGASVVLRCPIVPGANLNEDYIGKIIGIGRKYPNLTGISLLPYHSFGINKRLSLGKPSQELFTVPDKALMCDLKERIGNSVNTEVW